MISTRSGALVIDTVVCLTLAKWETVSGRFGGYLSGPIIHLIRGSAASMYLLVAIIATPRRKWITSIARCSGGLTVSASGLRKHIGKIRGNEMQTLERLNESTDIDHASSAHRLLTCSTIRCNQNGAKTYLR